MERKNVMTRWQVFKHEMWLLLRWHVPEFFSNMRKKIWNKRIKLWWYRLWIRKDEFHPSLFIDIDALSVMQEDERTVYFDDLLRRRAIAHSRSLY